MQRGMEETRSGTETDIWAHLVQMYVEEFPFFQSLQPIPDYKIITIESLPKIFIQTRSTKKEDGRKPLVSDE